MIEWLTEIDTQLFLFFNGLHSNFWDPVMYWVSEKEVWYPFYALVLFFVFWKYRWTGFWVFLSMVLVVTLADQSSVNLYKEVFERFRPCRPGSPIHELVHIVNGHCGGRYGFVSSHAANTFGFAAFVSLLARRPWIRYGIFIWAAVVSYSRVYLGVHYTGDILGGAILGVFIGILVFLLYDFLMHRLPYRIATLRYEPTASG